jgi:DMSO/TMAO reductase YedYZ molybdopterin-dependent catalytic subunit
MKKMTSGDGVLTVLALAFLTQLYACESDDDTSTRTENTENTEISEYEGTKLTAIEDFPKPSIRGVQNIDGESYELKVAGLVEVEKSYTYEEVLDNFSVSKRVVTLYCVDGWDVTALCEGVSLVDLIEASAPFDDVNTVIFHASDGYTTSLPLEYIMENNMMVAYKVNDIAMPAEIGSPFRLVVMGKWGYKWIKWLTQIELSGDKTYRGYWESRGYSNSGDIY